MVRKLNCLILFFCFLFATFIIFWVVPANSEMEPSFGCYYQMDDKYSNEQDKTKIEQWQKNKLRDISQKGILQNLFSHHGGGPHGAEWNAVWNPGIDFFCVAQIEWPVSEIKNSSIRLNDKEVNLEKNFVSSAQNNSTTLVYFMILADVWKKSLKPLTKADFPKRYDPQTIQKHQMNNNSIPLDTGDFVEITFEAANKADKRILLSGIFHVDSGE